MVSEDKMYLLIGKEINKAVYTLFYLSSEDAAEHNSYYSTKVNCLMSDAS